MIEVRTIRRAAALLALAALSACATLPPEAAPQAEDIQILALNDFHGNLEPLPGEQRYRMADGTEARAQLGGAARLGATLAGLRAGQAHTVTVAAGDLIGASPLVSAYYLDEPAIAALGRAGLEIAAVGNHEFDKGVAELRRMQDGGCNEGRPVGARQPCRLDPFDGASFTYLAANVIGPGEQTLFPASVMRQFGAAKVGFVGMTLKDTGTLTSPGGTVGYRFEDEAATANAEAARLRAAGADTVVLLIHEGARTDPSYNMADCPGLDGALLPILDRLDPEIRLVVSGHTHNAYACQMPAPGGSRRLVTSAGRYGYFVTDIRLTVDPARDAVTAFSAVNRPVEANAGEQADIAALVARYSQAVAGEAAKVVGRIDGSLTPSPMSFYRPLDYLVADAQFAATQSPAEGGAQFALMNPGGVRTTFDTEAGGSVTYGQAFALQPFGNTLSVVELTGAELTAGLEAALARAAPGNARAALLVPSHNVFYAFDLSRPAGSRLVSLTLDGRPLDPGTTYRVTVNNFLASGGDGFAFLTRARPVAGGVLDLDALQGYLAGGVAAPAADRVRDLMPAE
ncbi:MAG: bifunctional metallophosphatase/5'-nucleotidase [Croceibacterium sp.]